MKKKNTINTLASNVQVGGNEVANAVSQSLVVNEISNQDANADTQPATPIASQVVNAHTKTQSQPVETMVATVSACKAASEPHANLKPIKFFCIWLLVCYFDKFLS